MQNTQYPRYRIESNHAIVCPLLPQNHDKELVFTDRSLAIVIAAKSLTQPSGQEIRVVNTLSGEVVYRKTEGEIFAISED